MTQHNILEGILNATFGKASMQDLNKTNHALRHKLGTDVDGQMILEIRYERGVNFVPSKGLATQKKELDKDSFNAIGKKIADAKKEFRELAETTLKVKPISDGQSDLTPLQFNQSLVRARYRATVLYEIDV